MEPEFAKQIVRLHNVVGNAVTEGRHIVVGTGSSQLYLAALYALSPQDSLNPINVVSAAPYYSVRFMIGHMILIWFCLLACFCILLIVQQIIV